MIVFSTEPVPVEPDDKCPFKDFPQTSSMTYRRSFLLDVSPCLGEFITFYNKKYEITSLGSIMGGRYFAIGILVTKEQMDNILLNAKNAHHRWKKKIEKTVDIRALFMR